MIHILKSVGLVSAIILVIEVFVLVAIETYPQGFGI